jgi:hypothetical protein
MGEEYPFYHPLYKPQERRDMRQIKADFNKNLQRHCIAKTKAK